MRSIWTPDWTPRWCLPGDGGIGNDFAAIRISEGLTIDPHNPAGGPHSIYTGCERQGVNYYGHGLECSSATASGWLAWVTAR